MRGTVKWYNISKGFGFIVPNAESGNTTDVFFHFSSIDSSVTRPLREGESVSFELEQSERGLVARKVQLSTSAQQLTSVQQLQVRTPRELEARLTLSEALTLPKGTVALETATGHATRFKLPNGDVIAPWICYELIEERGREIYRDLTPAELEERGIYIELDLERDIHGVPVVRS